MEAKFMDNQLPPNPSSPSPLEEESNFMPVTQPWVHHLSMMQQGVILSAIRGPDGIGKNHVSKLLLRWYRRSIIMCAFDHRANHRTCIRKHSPSKDVPSTAR